MEDFNKLIYLLIAIKETAKSIHYTCTGESSYSYHLLADRIADSLDDFIDRCKENLLLGNDSMPLLSNEYLLGAINYIPDVVINNTIKNFKSLQKLIKQTLNFINTISCDKADDNLISEIADKLKNDYALLNLQIS